MFLLISTPNVDYLINNTSPVDLIEWVEKIHEKYKHEKTIDVEWLHREGFKETDKSEFIMEDHLCYEVADGKMLFISEDGNTMTVEDFLLVARQKQSEMKL